MSDTTLTHRTNQQQISGWINGFIGVLLFSGSIPATKVAIAELSPAFVTVTRAGIAGMLALSTLLIFKEKRPSRQQIYSLFIVIAGVVLGFPLLSALALQYISSAHSLVYAAMLPLSTALFAVLRNGERPPFLFWVFSVIGSIMVIGFALTQDLSLSYTGDILMLLATLLCGLGYAEGAKLSSELGGWQVISWALVIALPVTLPLIFIFQPVSFEGIHTGTWLGLGYVSLFSMFIGFVFWYKGLAQGGIAVVGQIQLLQPFFGLTLAALLLHEKVSAGMLFTTIGVLCCVAGSRKFGQRKSGNLFQSKS